MSELQEIKSLDDLFLLSKTGRRYYTNGALVEELLIAEEYQPLGWLNEGIKLPDVILFTEIYSNESGSYCIYMNKEQKLYYCVDMGD